MATGTPAALQLLAEDSQEVQLVDFVQIAGKKLSQRTAGERTQRLRRSNPF